MGAVMGGFVVKDHNQAGEERRHAHAVQNRVPDGAGLLLSGGMRGLKQEDSFSAKKKSDLATGNYQWLLWNISGVADQEHETYGIEQLYERFG